MHIKVSETNEITVTCVGKTKKEVLKDLADASAFVEAQLDVAAPKAAVKRKPRKKKVAVIEDDRGAGDAPPPEAKPMIFRQQG